MPWLEAFTSEQESFAGIFPGNGPFDPHPQRMDGGVEDAWTSALRSLAVTGMLLEVGDQTGRAEVRAMVGGIKAARSIYQYS